MTGTADITPGQWVHIAATYGTDHIHRVYVNGELDIASPVVDLGVWPQKSEITLGARSYFWSSQFFTLINLDGSLSGFRIYDRALSADEVATLAGVTPDGGALSPPADGLKALWRFDGLVHDGARPQAQIRTVDGRTWWSGALPVTLTDVPTGHYFVEAGQDRSQFQVLPWGYRGSALWGVSGGWNNEAPSLDASFASVQSRWNFEIGDCHWLYVEGRDAQGQPTFDWRACEQRVAQADSFYRSEQGEQAHRVVLLLDPLSGLPGFYNGQPAAVFLQALDRFLGSMLDRFADNPHVYGIRLLSELQWWQWPSIPREIPMDDVTALVAFAERASNIIRARGSHLKVLGVSLCAGQDFLARTHELFSAGLLQHVDEHAWAENCWDDRLAYADSHGVDLAREVPRQADLVAGVLQSAGQSIPLHVFQGAFGATSAVGQTPRIRGPLPQIPDLNPPDSLLPWPDGINRAIKYTASGFQNGLASMAGMYGLVHYMEWNHVLSGFEYAPGAGPFSDANPLADLGGLRRGPLPSTSALLMTHYWFDGASHLLPRGVRLPGQRWDRVQLLGMHDRDGQKVVLAWTAPGERADMNSRQFVAHDTWGTPIQVASLGEEGVYLVDSADTQRTLAEFMDSAAAAVSVVGHDASPGMVIHWTMDGPGGLVDSVSGVSLQLGPGIPGTSTVAAVGTGSLPFGETSGAVVTQHYATAVTPQVLIHPSNPNQLGISLWFRLNNNTDGSRPASLLSSYEFGGNQGLDLSLDAPDASSCRPVRLRYASAAGEKNVAAACPRQAQPPFAPRPVDTEWHHLALAARQGAMELYLDGQRVLQVFDTARVNFSDTIRLGTSLAWSGVYGWSGFMDDVRIYARTLSPADIRALAEMGPAP